MPLTGLRITAVGGEVAVRELHGPRSAETGQYLIDFELAPQAPGQVTDLRQGPQGASAQPASANDRFEAACALEAENAGQAEAAYRQAIALAPDFADAHLNLTALLCEREAYEEALAVCDEALRRWPGMPEGRDFRVRLVSAAKPSALDSDRAPDSRIAYDGTQKVVKLR